MSEVIAPRRRRLSDLYVTGTLITLTGPVGDGSETASEDVWVSKISPVEQKESADRASGARAAILAIKHLDDDHEKKLPYWDQLDELVADDRNTLINFLIAEKVSKAELSAEARLGAEGKWAENDYLSSLQEAWNDGLRDRYLATPDDEEASRVFNELKRFSDEVTESVKEEREDLVSSYDGIPDIELKRKAIDSIIQAEADFAWMAEFRRWQIFYATRWPDAHDERYFQSKDEVAHLDRRVFQQLVDAFNEITVDSIEGKD